MQLHACWILVRELGFSNLKTLAQTILKMPSSPPTMATTQPSWPKPFPLLLLPRELRDQIYEASLSVDYETEQRQNYTTNAPAEEKAVPQIERGYYIPVSCRASDIEVPGSSSNPATWLNTTYEAAQPSPNPFLKLNKQTRSEPLELFLPERLAFEAFAEPCWDAVEKWISSQDSLAKVKQMHVFASAGVWPFYPRRLEEDEFVEINTRNLPLFKLEIQNDGNRIVVKSRVRLVKQHAEGIQYILDYYTTYSSKFSLHGPFTGNDLMSILLELRSNERAVSRGNDYASDGWMTAVQPRAWPRPPQAAWAIHPYNIRTDGVEDEWDRPGWARSEARARYDPNRKMGLLFHEGFVHGIAVINAFGRSGRS